MSRVALEPGYVLHRRPFRETSLLLEVLTPGHGRVGLVARGARRARPSKQERIEPFVPLLLSWSRRGDLGSLTATECSHSPLTLTGEALMAGFYMNELMVRMLTRDDPNDAVFRIYSDTLVALAGDVGAFGISPLLRRFELQLLEEIGYGLQLEHEFNSAAPIVAGERYVFDIEAGARPAQSGERSHFLVSGDSLIAMHRQDWNSREELRDARRILRAAIARQIGSTPLQTPLLMRELSRLRETGAEQVDPS